MARPALARPLLVALLAVVAAAALLPAALCVNQQSNYGSEDHDQHHEQDHDQEAAATNLDPSAGDPSDPSDPSDVQAQDAAYQEARNYNQRAYSHDDYENDEDIVYDFSYEVKDPQSGNDFGHRQNRANGVTQGQYRVLLPDGRMQVVDYVSDRGGFRPNIRYEDVGIAVFAGSEQHAVFEDGTNHYDNQQNVNEQNSEFQRRRRRRR